MKMKAAVMRVQGKPRPYADSHPMTIETVDLDPPGPGEVLYKIIGAGLCHSDLSTIENLRPRRLPTIPGHEAAGIVEEVGAGVANLKPATTLYPCSSRVAAIAGIATTGGRICVRVHRPREPRNLGVRRPAIVAEWRTAEPL